VEHQGRRWRFNEDLYPERFNWKSVFVGTGAEIDALDIDANLVSRYPFDDTLGDSVGSNNLSGSMTYGSGVYGRAIAPSSQRAQASAQTVHEFGTSDFAFSFWLRLNAISGTQVIIGKRDPGASTNKGYRVYVDSAGKLVAEYCDGTASVISVTSSFTVSANSWYFIKVSFDRDGFLSLYYNEVGDSAVSISAQQGSIASNGQTFTVASDSPSGTNYLNGRLDQLQVFSGTVSDTSAQEIFGNRHAMQLLGCMETGSGLTKGYLYVVNEENTGTVRILRSAGDVDTYLRFLAQAEIRLADADSSNYVGLKGPGTVSANKIWTMPASDGAASAKDVLSTDGAAVLSFIPPNMKPLNIDDSTSSQACTGTQVTVKSYTLPANSFTRILVLAAGKWDSVNRAEDDPSSFDVTIDITGSTKTITHNPIQATTSQITDNSGDWHWFMMYSKVDTAGGTIAIKADHNGTDSKTITCHTFYVFALNY
jgi:hypothetical protein